MVSLPVAHVVVSLCGADHPRGCRSSDFLGSDLQNDPARRGNGSVASGQECVGAACPSPSSTAWVGEADTVPRGWQFPRGVGVSPAAHQQCAYLQLAGNVSRHVDGKHVNCVAAKMSKKIKIFFVGNPAPCLALLSILKGLCGWVVFFFYFYYLPFLFLMHDITALVTS